LEAQNHLAIVSAYGRSPLSLLVQVSGVGMYFLLGSEEPTMPPSMFSLFLLIVQESPLPIFFSSLSRERERKQPIERKNGEERKRKRGGKLGRRKKG
jgi:hypothetical protein